MCIFNCVFPNRWLFLSLSPIPLLLSSPLSPPFIPYMYLPIFIPYPFIRRPHTSTRTPTPSSHPPSVYPYIHSHVRPLYLSLFPSISPPHLPTRFPSSPLPYPPTFLCSERSDANTPSILVFTHRGSQLLPKYSYQNVGFMVSFTPLVPPPPPWPSILPLVKDSSCSSPPPPPTPPFSRPLKAHQRSARWDYSLCIPYS